MAAPTNPLTHIFASFSFGVVVFFALIQISTSLGELPFFASVLIEAGLFVLACLLGCAIAPTRPFRSAVIGALGVFSGVILDFIIYPTVNGFERNLFPLEAAFHALIAVPSFLLVAAAWKAAFIFFRRGEIDAQRIRLDRDREASHDLNRLLDEPGPGP